MAESNEQWKDYDKTKQELGNIISRVSLHAFSILTHCFL